MKVTIKFSYNREVIPPRCRKPRTTNFKDGEVEVDILNLDKLEEEKREELFPLAFVVHDKLWDADSEPSVEEYRGYTLNKQLYLKAQNSAYRQPLNEVPFWKSRVDSYEDVAEEIRAWAKTLIIFKGDVWIVTEAEPCYRVDISYHSEYLGLAKLFGEEKTTRPNGTYMFRADELGLAKAEILRRAGEYRNAEEYAKVQREMDNFENEVCRIDVLRIDFSKMLTYDNWKAEKVETEIRQFLLEKLEHGTVHLPEDVIICISRMCFLEEGFSNMGQVDRERVIRSKICQVLLTGAKTALEQMKRR